MVDLLAMLVFALLVAAVTVLIACIYMLPWLVAKDRRHPRVRTIFWFNLLLAPVGVCWIIAMIWACASPRCR